MPEGYGPAQARITRTPINFTTSLPDQESGRFYPPNPLAIQSIVSVIQNLMNKTPGIRQIAVNPESPDYSPDTIKHEEIHDIMSRLPVHIARGITTGGPYYNQIVQAISNRSGGRPEDEVAAYSGAYEPKVTPMLSDWVEGQKQHTLQQLNKIAPELGRMYSSISSQQAGQSQVDPY